VAKWKRLTEQISIVAQTNGAGMAAQLTHKAQMGKNIPRSAAGERQ